MRLRKWNGQIVSYLGVSDRAERERQATKARFSVVAVLMGRQKGTAFS